jgi:hypothetical protein
VFSPLTYIVHKNINTFINGQVAQNQAVNESSLFVQVAGSSLSVMKVSINRIINYLQPSIFTLISLTLKASSNLSKPLNELHSLYFSDDYGVSDVEMIEPAS